jgi:hypothetical protein
VDKGTDFRSRTVLDGEEVVLPGPNQKSQAPAGTTTPAALAKSLGPPSTPTPEKTVQPAPISYTPSLLAPETKTSTGLAKPSHLSTVDEPRPHPPSDFTVTLSGTAITIAPTVISGSGGSSIAYVLGSGTTLVPGGPAVTLIDGGTVSLPTNFAGPGSTTSGVGGAIESGLGYTGPQYTGSGAPAHGRGPLWLLSLIYGAIVMLLA